MDYFALKLIHLISLTLLFGTGTATAVLMVLSYRTGNSQICKITSRLVVTADWFFTTPSFFIQPISGYFLMKTMGLSFTSGWFVAIAIAYGIMSIAWFPVVWIQIRLRDVAAELKPGDALPAMYHRYMGWWQLLGLPAGLAVIFLTIIMVYKPWMGEFAL